MMGVNTRPTMTTVIVDDDPSTAASASRAITNTGRAEIASNIRMMVVPGSQQVKKQAEAEGLHEIFKAAGAEWREAGCSMCIAMNGDQLQPGQYAVSTSNRNFEGRQGKGGRTHLVSVPMAVAAAIEGKLVDVRQWDKENKGK